MASEVHDLMKKKCGVAGDLYLTRRDVQALLRWIKSIEEIQDDQMANFIELQEHLKPILNMKEIP